jgi:hypothetical protein
MPLFVALATLAMGCAASRPEAARAPRPLVVPAWVDKGGPSSPALMMFPGESTVALHSELGGPAGWLRERPSASDEH